MRYEAWLGLLKLFLPHDISRFCQHCQTLFIYSVVLSLLTDDTTVFVTSNDSRWWHQWRLTWHHAISRVAIMGCNLGPGIVSSIHKIWTRLRFHIRWSINAWWSCILFTHILQDRFIGTEATMWLLQCQWNNPERYWSNQPHAPCYTVISISSSVARHRRRGEFHKSVLSVFHLANY